MIDPAQGLTEQRGTQLPRPAGRRHVGRGSRVGRQRGSGLRSIDVWVGSRAAMADDGRSRYVAHSGLNKARMSALSRVPVVLRTGPEGQRIALCGRLSVGKGCVSVLRG
jgi:hypothetical protein